MHWQATHCDPLRQAMEVRKSAPSEPAPSVADDSVGARQDFNYPFSCLQGEILQGSLEAVYLTNYRFFTGTDSLPIATIRSLKLVDKKTLLVCTSEVRKVTATFSYSDTDAVAKFFEALQLFAFNTREIPFALVHQGSFKKIFDIEAEFVRLRFPGCRISSVNEQFAICSSYPERVVVPQAISDSVILDAAEFRDKQRFPVCAFPRLWRSAQPKTSIGNRSAADEEFLKALGPNLTIFDLRPMLNALANQLIQGSGSENVANYTNVSELLYCDIPNIHVVRDAFDQVFQGIDNLTLEDCTSGWWPLFESSGWYVMVGKILKAASLAQSVLQEGRPVLIHCSDGWDRTPQVTSLVMILEDPYYRTFEGFARLVEQEWVVFGHKFHDRLGIGSPDSRDFSPVLMQWLDCLHQVVRQHPDKFEFDDKFLMDFFERVISGRFVNFVFNSELERSTKAVYARGASLWPELFGSHQKRRISNSAHLRVEHRAFSMTIWSSFWLRLKKL